MESRCIIMPILDDGRSRQIKHVEIPLDRQDQAMKNHSQTLQTLKYRGGLSPEEAVAILKRQHWRSVRGMSIAEAADFLEAYRCSDE